MSDSVPPTGGAYALDRRHLILERVAQEGAILGVAMAHLAPAVGATALATDWSAPAHHLAAPRDLGIEAITARLVGSDRSRRIGRTIAINPGGACSTGALRGALAILEKRAVKAHQPVRR